MISHRLLSGEALATRLAGGSRFVGIAATLTIGWLGVVFHADAQVLTPSNVYMSVYHAPRLNNAGVAETRANAFTVLTNGVVERGGIDRIDTWNSDNLGVTLDFVGLSYASPSRFDKIVLEQGTQFGDGGDWEAQPKIYILKNTLLVGDTVEPNMSPNWVEVTGATTSHVFPPDTTGVVPGQIAFDLSTIPAANRTGWGWAVGGVDGNDTFHFVSLTEAWAEGQSGLPVPAVPTPSVLSPVNVVANAYHSVGRSGDGLADYRGQAFASLTNKLLDNVVGLANDGIDTFEGDGAGVLTDFTGLQYSSLNRFDMITVNLGNQFGDGGDWDSTPRIFILKNPVDTNTSRPETDPTNWREITGAVETTGHTFSPLVTPGAGGSFSFNLSGIPAAERTGWGWAVGGVDGNANGTGVINFVSVTELDATGAVIPRPYDLTLRVFSNGEVRLVNDTQFSLDLDFYQITSAGNALDVAGWNSLGDGSANPGTHTPANFPVGNGSGNGWEEFGNLNSSIVAEGYLQASSQLGASKYISLGDLYNGPAQDLSFIYRVAGGVFINGLVEYVASPGVPGDYNNNGVVDAADYVLWRKGAPLQNEVVTIGATTPEDYTAWRARFGNTSGSGSGLDGAAVPEPAAWVLALLALACLGRRLG